MDITLKQVEKIEYKYLRKYYYFLKFATDEMMDGFRTKEKIKDDWIDYYKSGISDFATGAERIVYALLNGKGIGQPNSSPVGSDLFFEVSDAFIHIDLKTVQTDNIGDFTNSIFVGENQNSYKGTIKKNNGKQEQYIPHLPYIYNENKKNEKICLSYFVTILYEKETLDILVISIMCMPNGLLEKHYGSKVLKAGKNPGKTRFHFSKVENFELLDGDKKRIQVVFFKEDMKQEYKDKLKFYASLYKQQIDK